MEAIVEHVAPLMVTTLVAVLAGALFQHLLATRSLSRLPFAGEALGSKETQRKAFLTSGSKMYNTAHEKFKDSICRLITARNADILVISSKFLPEMRKLPDNVLSMSQALNDIMESTYTRIDTDQPILAHVVKGSLTPALPRLNTNISAEVDEALRREIPPCEDWTPITISAKLLRIIAMVSGRVFVGPDLCHDETYLDAAINYTVDLNTARRAVQSVAPWRRWFTCNRLPEVQQLVKREHDGVAILEPVVAERLRRWGERDVDDQGIQKPDDVLQWMLDNRARRPGEPRNHYTKKDITFLAKMQLSLTFAAIHTTGHVGLNVLYTLAAIPDAAEEVRQEIEEMLGVYDNQFSTVALQHMKKLDSFVREVTRLYTMTFASFFRKVTRPFVLSNGQYIPKGVTTEISAYGIAHDPEIFPDPYTFDPFRFVGPNPRVGWSTTSTALVSVNPANLLFGYGRHACPGRFFAANEIKMITSKLLQSYEIRNVDFTTERYPNLDFAGNSVPDPRRQVLLKKRTI